MADDKIDLMRGLREAAAQDPNKFRKTYLAAIENKIKQELTQTISPERREVLQESLEHLDELNIEDALGWVEEGLKTPEGQKTAEFYQFVSGYFQDVERLRKDTAEQVRRFLPSPSGKRYQKTHANAADFANEEAMSVLSGEELWSLNCWLRFHVADGGDLLGVFLQFVKEYPDNPGGIKRFARTYSEGEEADLKQDPRLYPVQKELGIALQKHATTAKGIHHLERILQTKHPDLGKSDIESMVLFLCNLSPAVFTGFYTDLENIQTASELAAHVQRTKEKKESSTYGDLYQSEEMTEEKLIRLLNEQEFRLAEVSRAALTSRSGGSTVELEQTVRTVKTRLIEMQGGSMDRFRLKALPPLELKHRQEKLEEEIKTLEAEAGHDRAQWASLAGVLPKLSDENRAFLKELVQVVPTATPHRYVLFLKREELSDVRLRIKRGTSTLPKRSNDEEEIERMVSELDSIDALRKVWKAKRDNASSEEQRAAVDKVFRRAVDARLERL